jgi:Rod binding domain-containing protein
MDMTTAISSLSSASTRGDTLGARKRATLDDQQTFAASLGRATGPKTIEQEARESAEGLVSMALVQPVLKRLRESNQAAPPFGPAKGEQSMRTMLDQKWADSLVKTGNWALVDRVESKMLARLGKGPAVSRGPHVTQLAETRTQPLISSLSSPGSNALVTDLSAGIEPRVTSLESLSPTRVTKLR